MKLHLCGAMTLLFAANAAFAQPAVASWETEVRQFDERYWQAFDSCDVKRMVDYNAEDLEFYHDVGGASFGRAQFAKDLKNNLCSNPERRVRRAAVADTIKVYPLRERDRLYGAIISGEHQFFNTVKGQAEELTGQALFTHVLLLKNGAWQVSRVLSFSHSGPPNADKHAAVALPAAQLDQLAGAYQTKGKMLIAIRREGSTLAMDAGGKEFIMHASDANTFFVKGRDLTITFARAPNGRGHRLTVRENGNVVEEAATDD